SIHTDNSNTHTLGTPATTDGRKGIGGVAASHLPALVWFCLRFAYRFVSHPKKVTQEPPELHEMSQGYAEYDFASISRLSIGG
ncbi:hypothetical protein, partial [Salmonella enterica]|uniref:hypothetical protein n=1 Tax=Salmonella enterica TaxID=28901 RepID=UPI0020C451C7